MGIKKIKLISRRAYDTNDSNLSKEVEQQLTINETGRVWFSAKNIEQLISGKGHCRKRQVSIGKWRTAFLFNLVEKLPELPLAQHCDKYELDIIDENGRIRHMQGPLLDETISFSYGDIPVQITKVLRRYVPLYALWGFNSSLSPDYEGKKEIHLFAEEWQKKFLADKAPLDSFEKEFGDACTKLGFQMDSGEECNKRCPELMNNFGKDIHNTVATISDLDLLGSAVFCYWRYLTHWAWIYDLNEDTCEWFAMVLGRMKELTKKQ